MKHLFSDLWASIKKSPFLFLFLFIQIIITSLVLYSSLANYYWTEERSNSAQIAWGNKEYLNVASKTNMPSDLFLFFLNPRLSGVSDEIYQQRIQLLESVERFYTEASKLEGLTLIQTQGDRQLYLTELKDWEKEDKKHGEYDMFDNETYDQLHAYYVGSEYLDYFNVKLSEGEFFTEDDYLYEKEYIPVLMGERFRKYYTLGEEFKVKNISKALRVVGFISENQYYSPANSTSKIYNYDNKVVLPYIERPLSDFIDDSSPYKEYLNLYTSRFLYCYFISEPEQYEDIRAKLEELLVKFELNELFEMFKPRIEKELASNYKDQLAISIVVCITTLIFSLFSFVFHNAL